MEILQGVWKQHRRPRAVVGYGFKIFLPSPPNYVTRSPGRKIVWHKTDWKTLTRVSFSLSLSGSISISRANAHMVHMGRKLAFHVTL